MSKPLPRSNPAAEGVDPKALSAFLDAIAERKEEELHGLMVLRHGKVVAEGNWKPYAADRKHMLFSLSKSFTSTAVGFAVSEGLLSVDDPVLKFFPEDAPENPSRNWKEMKVRHLLSMSTGHDKDTMDYIWRRRDHNWAKAFLQRPVKFKPGTHFLYNTGATYMLSVIVQKLTGKTVLDYLTPRLFVPLGIEGAVWEKCPRGYNTGGFGLSIAVEDIARFGQFLLQRGMWEGRQLLPAAWVDEATRKHVENGNSDGTSDWGMGYGYQFWRCTPGCYRGDGAFGQYCIVVPKLDMVIAILSGLPDMQFPLNCLWEKLLPGVGSTMPENTSAQSALQTKLAALKYDPPATGTRSPLEASLSGKAFTLEKNAARLSRVRFVFNEGSCTVEHSVGRKKISIEYGRGVWKEQSCRAGLLQGNPRAGEDDVAASFTWAQDGSLLLTARNLAAPFVLTLRATITGDNVELNPAVNVSFGPTEFPAVKGKMV
jgi:CubicO group peptidase (beta-lactamase class C family)